MAGATPTTSRIGYRLLTSVLAVGMAMSACGCGLFGRREPELDVAAAARLNRQYARAEARLRSPEPDERRQAAVALLSMDYAPAFEALLANMRAAEDAATRVSVIEAAGFSGQDRCFRPLLTALKDPEPGVQEAAAAALARFTAPDYVAAMGALIEQKDTASRQRQLLLRALGDALAMDAVPVLIAALESDDPPTRVAAHEALQQISRRALPLDAAQWRKWAETASYRSREDVLEEHLKVASHDLDIRTDELGALREQQEDLMRLVRSADAETPRLLLEALASRHASVRQYAASRMAALSRETVAAVKLDRQDVAVLKAALADESPAPRRNVMRFVAMTGNDHRDELVCLGLEDEDPEVLTTAIEAVRSSAGADAVARVTELLAGSSHAEVREAAANALGKVGTAQSVPVLMRALEDSEENVRWFAAEGLRKLGASGAVPRLSEMLLTDRSARVREIAASALGELGQPAGVPALRRALNDPNERVREKAVVGLLALAKDNYERMMVIAASLEERGLAGPAEQVLIKIVEQYGRDPAMARRVRQAYERLAGLQKRAQDYAGAARTYARLDELTGGDPSVRRELAACWIGAGEPQRVPAAVEQWLAANGGRGPQVVALALESAESLATAGHQVEALAVVDLAAAAAGPGADEEFNARLEALRARLGG